MVAEHPHGSGKGKGGNKKKKQRIGLSRREELDVKARLRPTAPSEPWVETAFLRIEDVDPRGDTIVYRFENPKALPVPGMIECPECCRYVPPNSLEDFRGPNPPSKKEKERRKLINDQINRLTARVMIYRKIGDRNGGLTDLQWKNVQWLVEKRSELKQALADRRGEKMAHGYRALGDAKLCMDHKSREIQQAWGESPSARAIWDIRARKIRIEQQPLESERTNDLKRDIQQRRLRQ